MKTHRLARIAEVIREVAAETILFEMRDPRVKNVTVTRAECSADLQHAKVYVSIMGTPKEQKRALHGLQNAAGFVQSKLAKRLLTRFLPVITFVEDEGIKKSIEIARILKEEQERSGPSVDDSAEDAEDNDDEAAEGEEKPSA
jgi:ribosome-binding factor A